MRNAHDHLKEVFNRMQIENVPVLLSKSKLHDSLAMLSKSIVMAGKHMRDSAAEINAAFVVKKRVKRKSDLAVLQIRKKAVRKNDRTWKRC